MGELWPQRPRREAEGVEPCPGQGLVSRSKSGMYYRIVGFLFEKKLSGTS